MSKIQETTLDREVSVPSKVGGFAGFADVAMVLGFWFAGTGTGAGAGAGSGTFGVTGNDCGEVDEADSGTGSSGLRCWLVRTLPRSDSSCRSGTLASRLRVDILTGRY